MPEGALATTATYSSLWEPPQLDIPTRGQPMSARVEDVAGSYRKLVQELLRVPGEFLAAVSEQLDVPRERAVRMAAGVVTIQSAIEGRPATAAQALRWFLGDNAIRVTCRRRTEGACWEGHTDERLVALLPYALDPFGPTTRRALMTGQACPQERESRKRLGAFYTPGDVARALAEEVITGGTRRVLDPACGAGVFLRAAFTRLTSTLPPGRAVERLHGVDIDAAAIDACALVLTHDWLMRDQPTGGETPFDRFRQLHSRLIHANALSLFAQPTQSGRDTTGYERLPRGAPSRFDAILTNPPFARVGHCTNDVNNGFESLRSARNPAGLNMVWPFWELVSRVVTNEGRVGIVLPLSCAYLGGDAPRAARHVIFARGSWEMRFFDRTPDALFGDDVKQRVALAIRRPGQTGVVRTSRLRRWSAGDRTAALHGKWESVDLPARADLVLKVGSTHERDAIDHLHSLPGTLGAAARDIRLVSAKDLDLSGQAIAVAPTAYNWIGAYRDNAIAREARRGVAGKLLELTFSDCRMADAAYATLASHIFLWWWRATGDLFHVPRSALASAPLPLHICTRERLDRLATAGRTCWEAARTAPITSVNRGVLTVAYTPPADHTALENVDAEVGLAFGLSRQFVRLVRDDAVRLRRAGRVDRSPGTADRS